MPKNAILLVALSLSLLPPQVSGTPPEEKTSGARAEQEASEPQAAAPQRPVFEARIEQVRVDVIVMDGDGQFVEDLGFEDFVVYEDGVLQEVLNVQLVDLGVGIVADLQPLSDAELRPPAAEERTPPAAAEVGPPGVGMDRDSESSHVRPVGTDQGAMVFLIDAASLDPSARIRFARQWEELLQETEGVNVPRAVYLYDSMGNLTELSPLTYDTEVLRSVAEVLESFPAIGTSMQAKLIELVNLSVDYDTVTHALQQARAYESQELDRSLITLGRLTQFCDALAVRSGRTALVWVTKGVKLTEGGAFWAIAGDDPGKLLTYHPDILRAQQALHQAANSANVSIYSIDPSLPGSLQNAGYAPESESSGSGFINEEFVAAVELDRVNQIDGAIEGLRDSLRDAADATGGEAFLQAGDMGVVLREIREDGRQYYLLTYAVPPPLGDDEYHDIRVEVQRSGVDVRARGGYVDLAPMDRRTRSVAAALMVPGTVASAPVVIKAFRMWSAEGQPVVDLAVTVESVEEAEKRGGMAAEWEGEGPDAEDPDTEGSDAGASVPWKELHAMVLSDSMEIVDELHIDVQRPVVSSSEDGAPSTSGDGAASRPFVYVHTWELPPGEQDIRVVVTDAATGQLRAAQLQLEVPEPSKGWTTSDLMLTVSDGNRPFQPLVDNEVIFGERLEIYVEVFGGRGPAISGLVFGSNPRQPLAELTQFSLPEDSAGIHRGALWLEGIPPGRYTLKIRVVDPRAGGERDFEVPLVSLSRTRGRR